MFRRLGWQLTLSFFVVILLSMALLGFYMLTRLDDLFTQDVESSIHHEAQLVALVWGLYNETGTPINQQQKRIVYNLCSMLTWQYGSRIRILDMHGNPIMDTVADPNPVLKDRLEVQQALQDHETTATWLPELEGDPPRMAVAFPVKIFQPGRGGPRKIIAGVVYVSRSMSYLRQVLHDLRFDFVAGTLLSLLGSGFLGIFFSQLLSNPLRRISAAAEQMARGDMSAMVMVRSQNEIGDLARSFNYMASELGRRTGELMEEKNKLSAVLTHMQGGAFMVDAQGKVLMGNRSASAMLGVPPEAGPEQSEDFQRLVDPIIASRQSGSQEVRLASKVIAQVRWTPVFGEGGELLGFVILLSDITEIRRLDEMKTEFVSNVSHELRTPLAALKGLAEILLDGALKEEEGKKFLRSINKEINRLTRLVKDLLDLSRIESGLVKFDTRPVALGELVHEVLQRMQGRLEAITVVVDPRLEQACAMADPDRVEQVVINLLDNAARYTPAGGSIVITAAPMDGFWHVGVENEGTGIPTDELGRIFERFYRIDKHRSRDQGGTGLGLSISRHIVERMGGRIWAESAEHWTRFLFTLPLIPDQPEPSLEPSEPATDNR